MLDLPDELFCKNLPKVELHAHLNGSISDKTLLQLMQQKMFVGVDAASASIEKGDQRTMEECFDCFKLLHKLVDNIKSLEAVATTVLQDFENENIKYLELRSTPRNNQGTSLTKRAYIETILDVIKKHHSDDANEMIIRYLPSIDRGKPVSEGWETIKLVEEFLLMSDGDLIPGIDFSGNPFINTGSEFIPLLQYAKNIGLKLAVHMSEVKNSNEETRAFLSIPPDRIGHGTYIAEDKHLFELVKLKQIPLEICVTSNIKSKTAPENVYNHHISHWVNFSSQNCHPCILGTDDKGVFATSLSSEYLKVADAFKLSKKQIFSWSRSCIDFIFANEMIKSNLRKVFDQTVLNFDE